MCRSCQKRFQYSRRKRTDWTRLLWRKYAFGKQNLAELADEYKKSVSWIRQQLNRYDPPSTQPYQELNPRQTVLVIDAFYQTRGDGILVFRSPSLRQNLLWTRIAYETIAQYEQGIEMLKRSGWQIQGVVIDGRRGVINALSRRFPVQMCHFHQQAIIRRYLTGNPQSVAAKRLSQIVANLPRTTKPILEAALVSWYKRYGRLLKEKTFHPGLTATGRPKWSYTHRRLRSGYRSLITNLANLFTYQEFPEIGLPNTTNSQDGSVTHIRNRIRLHCGLKLNSRLKLTDMLLRGKSPKK